MALLDAGMEAFSGSRLFDDYEGSAGWLETAIKNESSGILDDIKVEHDIWQGAAAVAAAAVEPAQLPAAEPAWPARSACDSYSGSSSGSSTASASPSRMQADMLDMMDFGDLDMGMPAMGASAALDLPDCFSGLPELPDQDAFNPDSVRADVMFSSSLSFLDKPHSRNRDNSLTLSECADSLFKDLDILGTSPNSSNNLNAFFDTPMASECGSDTEQEEEEIEVVDNKTIVSNNTTYYVSKSKKAIKAGKSLLRKNHKKASADTYTDRPRPSTSILESAQLDHCYSTATPPPEEEEEEAAAAIPHGALAGSAQTPLTPTASSDDEYERGRNGTRQSLLGKRKHSETTTSSMDDGELKFKFRMKFGSSYSPDRRRGPAEDHIKVEPVQEEETPQRHGPKRRSAMKNTHCPSPAKEQQPSPPTPAVSPPTSQAAAAAKSATAGSLKALRKAVSSSRQAAAAASERPNHSGEQKCRELRDLHNSMERQRRVDLKINFDQLKDKVPELRDTDKASKMVILNKAAEYSRLLLKTDLVLTSERDRVARRNAELRQRLESAKRSYHNLPSLGFHSISKHSISRRQHHMPSLMRY